MCCPQLGRVSQARLALLAAAGAPPVTHALQQSAWPRQAAPGAGSAMQEGGMLLVGPEGDFTPEEQQQLAEAGAKPVGLGAHRLRTETAAIALLATAMLW